MKKIIAVVLSIIISLAGIITIGHFIGIANFLSEHHEIEKAKKNPPEKIRIRNEIKTLMNHEWAGEYFLGNGYWSITMLLAPESGYALEIHTDMGSSHRHYGAVSEKNGRIYLADNKLRVQFLPGNAEELIPIQWGPRRYLIPADDVIGFCNEINEGKEPCNWIGTYFLRRGDEKKSVFGFPNIPQEFSAYLLEQPIVTEIIAVGSPEPRGRECEDWKYPVTLNAGTNHGLLPGMKLYLVKRDNFVRLLIIKKVDDVKSEGVISLSAGKKTAPVVGWRLSTHNNRWRRKSISFEMHTDNQTKEFRLTPVH